MGTFAKEFLADFPQNILLNGGVRLFYGTAVQCGKECGTKFPGNGQIVGKLKSLHPGKRFPSENAIYRAASKAHLVQAGLQLLHVVGLHIGSGTGGNNSAASLSVFQQGFEQIRPFHPRTILHLGSDQAIVETTGFNGFAAANIHAHMTETEKQNARNIGQVGNRAVLTALLFASLQHPVCALVQASVGSVPNGKLFPTLDIGQNAHAAVCPEDPFERKNTILSISTNVEMALLFRFFQLCGNTCIALVFCYNASRQQCTR